MNFQYISRDKVLMMPIMIIMIISTTSNSNLSYSKSNGDSLTFEDPLSGVQFQYTADEWVKQGSSLFGAEAECSSLPCMKLPEISVSVYPIATEDFSLENYTKEESYYHNLSEGYKPIALNETTIGEKKAFQYVYSIKSPLLIEEASNEIMTYEIYTTEGINLYKISFSAIQDEQFDKYLNSFKKMMDTFEITR